MGPPPVCSLMKLQATVGEAGFLEGPPWEATSACEAWPYSEEPLGGHRDDPLPLAHLDGEDLCPLGRHLVQCNWRAGENSI